MAKDTKEKDPKQEAADAHAKQTAEHEAIAAKAVADLLASQEAAVVKAKADAEAAAAKLANASREKRWASLVENFKRERPLAYEARKHTGEFDTPPADFQ